MKLDFLEKLVNLLFLDFFRLVQQTTLQRWQFGHGCCAVLDTVEVMQQMDEPLLTRAFLFATQSEKHAEATSKAAYKAFMELWVTDCTNGNGHGAACLEDIHDDTGNLFELTGDPRDAIP